jgi:hypothetical protein
MNQKKSTPLFVICLFITLTLFSQEKVKDQLTSSISIFSKALQTQRNIQVSLPDAYHENKKKYPVIYLLDGQLFFPHTVSLRKTFAQFRLTPQFIIVGIETPFPKRYRTFRSNRANMITFIDRELTSYINSKYRTNNQNIFFGWQYAGSVGFDIFKSNSDSFSTYLLAGPYPIEHKVKQLPLDKLSNKLLYFSVSPDEYDVNRGTDTLDSLLTSTKNLKFQWSYLELANEEHLSTAFPTLYHGLRKHFEYYSEFQQDNLSKFLKMGGLDYAYQYSKLRGEQYGFSKELSDWSKYTIIRSAIRANDFSYFEKFMNEFMSEDFIKSIKNRALEFASFYDTHKKYSKSIAIYNQVLKIYPKSKRILLRIAKAYELNGDLTNSKKYSKLAKAIKE